MFLRALRNRSLSDLGDVVLGMDERNLVFEEIIQVFGISVCRTARPRPFRTTEIFGSLAAASRCARYWSAASPPSGRRRRRNSSEC